MIVKLQLSQNEFLSPHIGLSTGDLWWYCLVEVFFFFPKTWWKYSLRWQFANLVADMVTSQSPISGNRKHWYHNIGRHQCCPGDILREKDCRKLALGQLLSAEATTRFQVWNSKWSGVSRTIKILLELPSFLQIITIIIQTTIVYYSKKLHHHLQ